MFKKTMCLICALLLLACAALAEGGVNLSGSAIIDGSRVYYSGSLDSAQEGVYLMNSDGSGSARLSDHAMTLLAAEGGSLLAISLSEPEYEYAVVVMDASGGKRVVFDGYVTNGIAAGGRFYWGVGSCALDGSDVRTLIGDTANSYYYYPLAVDGEWYYYLDWAANGANVYYEGDPYPTAARLCRLNLNGGNIQVVSDYGTRFLGVDGSYIYYARNDYWLYDEEEMDTYVAQINSGLFRADKNTLSAEQLQSFPAGNQVFISYELMADGVIYGTMSDYTSETPVSQIIRVTTDGTQLPALSLGNQYAALHAVENGMIYASVCYINFSDDDYIQSDLLYAINIQDGSATLISTPASDLFYYSETPPAIGVAGGRIYMIVLDNSAYAISFKSCALDGTGLITLARGYSMAEG